MVQDKPTLGKRDLAQPGETPMQRMMRRGQKMDSARQSQIANQRDSINRLLRENREAQQVVWGQSVIIYVLLEMLGEYIDSDGVVTITKDKIEAAPGGQVETQTSPNGDMHIRIKRESADG